MFGTGWYLLVSEQDPEHPVLHSHVSAAGNTEMAPEDAFDLPDARPNKDIGQVCPRFDPIHTPTDAHKSVPNSWSETQNQMRIYRHCLSHFYYEASTSLCLVLTCAS